MWVYKKKLQMPVRVSGPDVKMAGLILTQFGGPDGELSAAIRYLTQRWVMPTGYAKAILTDIGTEELAHWEMIGTMVYKLSAGTMAQDWIEADQAEKYAIRGKAVFPVDSEGNPWTSAYIQAHDDPIANMHEDMAAEQKARATYEYLINLSDDPCLSDGLRFLREREVVHFQRFGETLDRLQEDQRHKKYY